MPSSTSNSDQARSLGRLRGSWTCSLRPEGSNGINATFRPTTCANMISPGRSVGPMVASLVGDEAGCCSSRRAGCTLTPMPSPAAVTVLADCTVRATPEQGDYTQCACARGTSRTAVASRRPGPCQWRVARVPGGAAGSSGGAAIAACEANAGKNPPLAPQTSVAKRLAQTVRNLCASLPRSGRADSNSPARGAAPAILRHLGLFQRLNRPSVRCYKSPTVD